VDPIKKKELRGFSPQANYTDLANAIFGGEVSANFCR
jgi:hypothetical protein